jgi:predicted metal-dependent enzyme (double-stranded beta helix superfamily)
MAYSLQQFCADSRAILTSNGLDKALPQVADKLKRLLVDADFVAQTFDDDMPPGKRVLHHDKETGMYVLAHVQQAGKGGTPHSHGASWAIYGNVQGNTDMTEWRRVNAESEDHAVLELAGKYTVGPGQTGAYGPGVIHSTAHPAKAWVVRVTGTDLDTIPRYHFQPRRDKILEKA